MFKAIRYAFPSSTMAKRFGCAREGCYYVTLAADYTSPETLAEFGPCDTIGEAELVAGLAYAAAEWSPFSKRAPA